MHLAIERMVGAFESGRIGRRDLLAGLGALVASALAQSAGAAGAGSTFRATGLSHVALRVTDIARSRDFYLRHLGARVLRESESNCFLGCGGSNFVALFRSAQAGLDHYCYTIDAYDAGRAVEALRAAGLNPERHADRVYFDDPDGLTVQVTGEWDDFPGPRP